jgi:3',5'-cyclic AMP phosphodiesterase CpdA
MIKKYFEERPEKPLFSYAIISDTHIRPDKGDKSSPWEVNKYANGRARWVIEQINHSNPDFVVHMGDIVHPFPRLTTYGDAAEIATQMHIKLNAPLYFIPGNHDVGDKKNPTMPAHAVDDYGLDMYQKYFGPLYQSFDHKGLHLILVNSQAFNSDLPHESEHIRWLEADLKIHRGKRIHIFTHYPPYVFEPHEPNNYDNIDEPLRSWFLELLEQYKVEVLFSGHVHHFIYRKHGITDCYNLFSTSFVRQDYAEMFRVEAADEYGRNDAEKLGWCIVDMYENTHIARIHRSNGTMLGEQATHDKKAPKVNTYHTKDSVIAPVGVHLRHPWAEVIDLPYNGPMDEFVRKRVRNDYTLLGLWECGIQILRIPLSDLAARDIRSRMEALAEMGHRFSVFNCGIPSGDLIEVLRKYHHLIYSLEIIFPWRNLSNAIVEIKKFREKVSVPLFLGNIMSSADQKQQGSKFSHYVSYGFHATQTDRIEEFLSINRATGIVDGFIFRVGAHDSPWNKIKYIGSYALKKNIRAITNVRLASENPAEYAQDDVYVANRVAEAIVAATAVSPVDVFLDTFVDLDRGYFPRIGLYNRLYNRRLGSFVFAHIHSVINDYGADITLGKCEKHDEGRTCIFEYPNATFNLFLPVPGKSHLRKTALLGKASLGSKGKAKLIELHSGTISEVNWEKNNDEITLRSLFPSKVPSLLILEHETKSS